MTSVTLDRPWLSFDLGQEMQVLSWALNRPGFVRARHILWREVRNADLPEGFDARAWLIAELHRRGLPKAVAFLTSRDVTRHHRASASIGEDRADCLATVGLGNAERVGQRRDFAAQDWGTINIAIRLTQGLTQPGLIEALSIATQARTAAILDAGLALPGGLLATGTGTDCLAIAAPPGTCDHAGLHTATGEVIGAAVYRATLEGACVWLAEDRQPRR